MLNKIRLTIGINEGYFHNNESVLCFEELLQNLCEKEFIKNNIEISFVCYKSKTIYLKSRGCPAGGEDTYTIETVFHPEKHKDYQKFIDSAHSIINELKKTLKQHTVLVEYSNIDIKYLK